MMRVILFMLINPLMLSAQSELTGMWRLKDSKVIKGFDYANAIPLTIEITQKADSINWITISNNGQDDTTIIESFVFKVDSINEITTNTGKKKLVSFRKTTDGQWLKQTEYFSPESPGKLKSINKESYAVSKDGTILTFVREYDGSEGLTVNKEFTIFANYEKLTPEQVVKERISRQGVHFVDNLSWDQIKRKAKKENKFIFIDCYATWCRPCKVMDKSVFSLSTVGEVVNDQFVSVKVQMDTGKNDAPYVKKFYSLARELEKEFRITALPSYLFLAANGQVVHKVVGQQTEKQFIELLRSVKDPANQLYTLLKKAKNKELPFVAYPDLANRLANSFGNNESATEVAGIYYNQYLLRLSEEYLLVKANLDFIGYHPKIVSSGDKFFELCRLKPELVDNIKEYKDGGWAKYIVSRTIKRESIDPVLGEANKEGKEPDWEMLERKLIKMYGDQIAVTLVLSERVGWYREHKDWSSFLMVVKPYLSRVDLRKANPMYVNSCAWSVFKYSDDKELMKEAIGWMDIVTEKKVGDLHFMLLDTKAFLLYKMERKDEAIDLMKKTLGEYPQEAEYLKSRIDILTKGGDVWLNLR